MFLVLFTVIEQDLLAAYNYILLGDKRIKHVLIQLITDVKYVTTIICYKKYATTYIVAIYFYNLIKRYLSGQY